MPDSSFEDGSRRGANVLKRRAFLIGSVAATAAVGLGSIADSWAVEPAPYVESYLSPGPLAAHPEDTCLVIRPRSTRGLSPAVFYLHGAGQSAFSEIDGSPELHSFLRNLAADGYTVVVADFGDPNATDYTGSTRTFANRFVTERIEEYRLWLAHRPSVAPNVSASAIGLLGSSMGACNALAYARDYRASTNVVASALPFTDIAWTRADRTDPVWYGNGLLAAVCDIAWQLTDADPTPADADLNAVPALVGLPWRGYYRSDDGLINPARLDLMRQHIGSSASIIDVGTTGGHNPSIWGDISYTDFTSWFGSCFPTSVSASSSRH